MLGFLTRDVLLNQDVRYAYGQSRTSIKILTCNRCITCRSTDATDGGVALTSWTDHRTQRLAIRSTRALHAYVDRRTSPIFVWAYATDRTHRTSSTLSLRYFLKASSK